MLSIYWKSKNIRSCSLFWELRHREKFSTTKVVSGTIRDRLWQEQIRFIKERKHSFVFYTKDTFTLTGPFILYGASSSRFTPPSRVSRDNGIPSFLSSVESTQMSCVRSPTHRGGPLYNHCNSKGTNSICIQTWKKRFTD